MKLDPGLRRGDGSMCYPGHESLNAHSSFRRKPQIVIPAKATNRHSGESRNPWIRLIHLTVSFGPKLRLHATVSSLQSRWPNRRNDSVRGA